MIHVTCGSHQSVSLEIFLNFFTLLSSSDQKNYLLHVNTNFLNDYAHKADCSLLNLNTQNISLRDPKDLCVNSIHSALGLIQKDDILLTLPAAKEDLVFNHKTFLGHTEFLRNYFGLPHLPMTFVTPSLLMLLLTDHIPLSNVPKTITSKIVCDKIITLFNCYPHAQKIKRLIFWGINPHAGENKILGHEEQELVLAIKTLEKQYPHLNYIGPIPSDGTFTYKNNPNELDLIISPYHDQGLVYLKSTFGFMASNVTFGGPFIRLSPDHGTAANLMFKKKALYTSLLWTHQLIKSWK
jgi:4-hydroxythreonine-4-phosphate dehydrogenase